DHDREGSLAVRDVHISLERTAAFAQVNLLGTGTRGCLIRDNQGRSCGNHNRHEADHGISRIDAPYHIADTIDGPPFTIWCTGRARSNNAETGRRSPVRARLGREIDDRGWPCVPERLSLQP